MRIDPRKLFVCEYSQEQDAIHVTDLADSIRMNRMAIANGWKMDFQIVAIGTFDEMLKCDIVDKLKIIKAREMLKGSDREPLVFGRSFFEG